MTIRKTIEHLRLGCHDTMSAFAPYRMAHGGYWVRHRAAGWHTVQRYRYDTYNRAGAHPSIAELEDNTDPWQIWGVRIVTGIIAASGVMVAVILS